MTGPRELWMETDLAKPLRKRGPAGPPPQCLTFMDSKFPGSYKCVKTKKKTIYLTGREGTRLSEGIRSSYIPISWLGDS